MLDEMALKEHKELLEKANSLSREKSEIIAVAKEKNKQGMEILKGYGFSSPSDVSKLKDKLAALEADILAERAEAEAEILSINSLKEKLDELLIS